MIYDTIRYDMIPGDTIRLRSELRYDLICSDINNPCPRKDNMMKLFITGYQRSAVELTVTKKPYHVKTDTRIRRLVSSLRPYKWASVILRWQKFLFPSMGDTPITECEHMKVV